MDIYTGLDLGQRVRNLLRLTDSEFTDSVISSYDFAGLAEIEIKADVPSWQDILNGSDENQKDMLKTCVVFQTALILAPTARKSNIKLQQTTHAKIEFFDNTFDLLVESIGDRLSKLILTLNGGEFTVPPLVTITNPESRYYGSGFDI